MSGMETFNEFNQSSQSHCLHIRKLRLGSHTMTRSSLIWLGLAISALPLAGCASSSPRSTLSNTPSHTAQDSQAARHLNAEGLSLVEADNLEAAEDRFRQAIQNDLYYAPAHNNLGLVLMQLDNHYEAAWEFQSAAKMMPHAPEPRNNLGLLYENLGRLGPAITAYEAALEIDPANIVAMRHVSRVYVKSGRSNDKLKDALETMLSIPDSGQWDYWARGQLVRLGRND
jgi:tetratricopeptide (TPR) repeat protein